MGNSESVILFTLILIVATSLLTILIKRRFTYWQRNGVMCLPPSFPCGNATDLFLQKKSMSDIMQKTYQQVKNLGEKYAGMYIFFNAIFVPIDNELIKGMLSKDFVNHFSEKGIFYNEKIDPLSAHLFSLRHEAWKPIRAKLSPTFSPGKIKLMVPLVVECGKELSFLLEHLKEETIAINDICARYTIDVIGSCAFGINCNSLADPNAEFRKFGEKVFHPNTYNLIKSYLQYAHPDLMLFLNTRWTTPETSDFFLGVFKKTFEYREKTDLQRNDFLNLLMQLKDGGAEQVKLTKEQMAAQSFVFFLGGYETSSTTLSYCLFELSCNHDIQNELRNEITKVLEKHGGEITYESVSDMHYMDKVVNETLRKYPPVSFLNRVCTKEYVIPGTEFCIPADSKICIPIIGLHRDPEYYPEPEKFDPERFNEENVANRKPYTFIPFGEGPRICIGQRFGMIQTKVALAVFLKSYEYSLNEKTKTPLETDPKNFLLGPKGSIWLDIKPIG